MQSEQFPLIAGLLPVQRTANICLYVNPMKKKALPLALFFLFTTIGVVMAVVRENWWYCPMFAGIGIMATVTTILSRRYPPLSQFIRLMYLSAFGIFLFAGLSLRLNLNFQFPQVIFDGAAGIVSGAFFQLLIARLVVPFFLATVFAHGLVGMQLFLSGLTLVANHRVLGRGKNVQHGLHGDIWSCCWFWLFLSLE